MQSRALQWGGERAKKHRGENERQCVYTRGSSQPVWNERERGEKKKVVRGRELGQDKTRRFATWSCWFVCQEERVMSSQLHTGDFSTRHLAQSRRVDFPRCRVITVIISGNGLVSLFNSRSARANLPLPPPRPRGRERSWGAFGCFLLLLIQRLREDGRKMNRCKPRTDVVVF